MSDIACFRRCSACFQRHSEVVGTETSLSSPGFKCVGFPFLKICWWMRLCTCFKIRRVLFWSEEGRTLFLFWFVPQGVSTETTRMTGCNQVSTSGVWGRWKLCKLVQGDIVALSRKCELVSVNVSQSKRLWYLPSHPTLLWVRFYYQRAVTMAFVHYTWPDPHFTTCSCCVCLRTPQLIVHHVHPLPLFVFTISLVIHACIHLMQWQ